MHRKRDTQCWLLSIAIIIPISMYFSLIRATEHNKTKVLMKYYTQAYSVPKAILPTKLYNHNFYNKKRNTRRISHIFDTNDLEKKLLFKHNDKKCCFPLKIEDFIKNLEYQKLIGSGTYGNIYKIRTKCCKNIYAMKNIVIDNHNKAYIDEELYFMRYFQYNNLPHIVRSYYGYYSDYNLDLIYEFLYDTLDNVAYTGKNYDGHSINMIIKSLVLAVAGLHKHKIIHCDIKPQNIGIDKKRIIKIFDFGVSKKLDSKYPLTRRMGTIVYTPPEHLDVNISIDYSIDWWALGITFYTLIENHFPYKIPGKNLNVLEQRRQYKINIEQGLFRPIQNKKVPRELKDFIEKLLLPDKNKRLGVSENAIEDILNHKYFRNSNIKNIYKVINI